MSEWAELAKLCLRPRYAFVVLVASLIILLLPLPDPSFLTGIRKEHGKWVALVALLGGITWLVEMFLFVRESRAEASKKKAEHDAVLCHLDSLTSKETFLLARALVLKQQTVMWQAGLPEVASLVHKGLLQAVEYTGGNAKPFTIPRFVWDHIKNPKLRLIEKALEQQPDKKNLLTAPEATPPQTT